MILLYVHNDIVSSPGASGKHKIQPELYIPSDEEIQRLVNAVQDTELEIPVLLGAFAYIMADGGWRSDKVLKSVYRHAMDDRKKEMSDIANSHFSQLFNTKCNTKNKTLHSTVFLQ